jgi:hypothetical protein
MKANFTNITTEKQNRREGGIFRLNNVRRTNSQTGRRRDMLQERIEAQEREMRLREMEEQRILKINEDILRIREQENFMAGERELEIQELKEKGFDDSHEEIVRLREENEKGARRVHFNVSVLNEQINQIRMARTEREQAAIERELQRQQQELDERMRERERIANENRVANKNQDELEAEQERSAIKNLTMISARMDKINLLSGTRASMRASVARLRGEADFDLRRQDIANEQILTHVRNYNLQTAGKPMEAGHLFDHNPLAADSYKSRHLQKMESGISRLSAFINYQVGAMYRDGQKMQEEQLRVYREKSQIPNPQDDDEDVFQNSIDLRL